MLAVRLILTAVFLVSAVAKAISPRRTAAAARDLGVPASLAPAVAVALPLAETAVAVLLALTPTVTVGAAAATGLMAAFTALIAGNLMRDRRPACACFGSLSAGAPIGAATLVRNSLLLAGSVAVLVAALLPAGCSAGCYDAAGAWDVAVAGGLALLAMLVVGAIVVQSLSTTVGRLAGRVRELEAVLGRGPARPPGDSAAVQRAATEATVRDRAGRDLPLAEAIGGSAATQVLLLSSHCSACQRLRDRLREAPPPADLRVLGIIDRLDAEQVPVPGDPLEVFTDGGRIAATAGVQAFPSAVLLDADLRPIGELLTGTTQIRTFLDGRAAAPIAITEGDPLHV
jgi:hypothetical protein